MMTSTQPIPVDNCLTMPPPIPSRTKVIAKQRVVVFDDYYHTREDVKIEMEKEKEKEKEEQEKEKSKDPEEIGMMTFSETEEVDHELEKNGFTIINIHDENINEFMKLTAAARSGRGLTPLEQFLESEMRRVPFVPSVSSAPLGANDYKEQAERDPCTTRIIRNLADPAETSSLQREEDVNLGWVELSPCTPDNIKEDNQEDRRDNAPSAPAM
eukprot:TRINITY_DN1950_c0_g3_i2.p1 TRINITY_DN1950_c0_g3~~TRINITY_DN1950_c0_g3_i2.p1  ORF type:complete len:213 (+),score=69.13 TRINITY_DN1950_c0_g3_i2:435-1073(+)